jgi:hypothetical protein
LQEAGQAHETFGRFLDRRSRREEASAHLKRAGELAFQAKQAEEEGSKTNIGKPKGPSADPVGLQPTGSIMVVNPTPYWVTFEVDDGVRGPRSYRVPPGYRGAEGDILLYADSFWYRIVSSGNRLGSLKHFFALNPGKSLKITVKPVADRTR